MIKWVHKLCFSRSHFYISFRDIDLFCVTYPGPFFVIKRERVRLWHGGYLCLVAITVGVYLCVDMFLCVQMYILVCYCVANEREAVLMKRGGAGP